MNGRESIRDATRPLFLVGFNSATNRGATRGNEPFRGNFRGQNNRPGDIFHFLNDVATIESPEENRNRPRLDAARLNER